MPAFSDRLKTDVTLSFLLRANQNKNWQMEKKNSREIISIKLKVNKAENFKVDMDYGGSARVIFI